MSKTVSARLPESKHDELRERCNQLGCTMNDFVKASVEYVLEGQSDFNFGDDEDDIEDDEPSDIEPEPISRKRPELDEDKFKSHHDKYGNYWTYDENTTKWHCLLNPKNLKISQ